MTTGQQPGLFTGPLYTIYKALSAVRLARALETVLDRPVVPLFWVASDDHDWAEANHVHVLDRDNTIHKVTLDGPATPPVSMRNRLLDERVESALDALTQYLPTTEFAAPHLERIREAYRPGRSVAGAFTDLLAALLAPFDLLIVDGGQPELKRLTAELMRHELEASAEHEAALAMRARQLEAAGYHVQVPVLEGATNLFYEDEEGRDRIFRAADGGYSLRRSGRAFRAGELEALLDTEPERFSANVALRPVVESAVFPTVAYVGGPGEVSYFAELGPLFEAHGIGMPMVFPRHSVTIVEGKVRKVLDKFGLSMDALRRPAHEVAAQVLRQEMPDEVTRVLGELRRQIGEGYGRLTEAARGIDPTLKGPLQSARNASFMQLTEAEKKIAQHLKKQNDLGLDQIEKARANLFPGGDPQERVLNIHQYLVRYGDDLLRELHDAMEVRFDGVTAVLP